MVKATVTKPDADYKAAASSSWSIWDSKTHDFTPILHPAPTIEGTGEFFFDYADNFEERVLILSGTATLTPTNPGGGKPFSIKAGDAVSFPQGFAANWNVTTPMTKHYCYFDSEGNETASNAIACDGCGVDSWEESFFVEESGEDFCVDCYGIREDGEHQKLGVAFVEPPKKKQKKS
ncbi:hypothetical protein ScalyP_jg5423 [Parmales sp. scaly parma]|nr:hypothetical protein ScalyP_jg5423 [Parmales sp. scaly parma]